MNSFVMRYRGKVRCSLRSEHMREQMQQQQQGGKTPVLAALAPQHYHPLRNCDP